ncbi:MAG TPA: 4-hydroxy-tetrahydrodipicolinate reductase [Dehalococcoidia bacterium]|nr:4-hydroxy-tetrahydrodipicolinate reductase [Dehalococcoidia bacterium]
MKPIRIAVHGASGRMGQQVIDAICREPETRLVGAVELKTPVDSLPLPDGSGSIPFSSDLLYIIKRCRPQVIIDFTNAKAAMSAVRLATKYGINMVIGSTGLTTEELDEIDKLAIKNGVGVVVAPNFALGAVLMMHLSQIAARYFDYAEIIELHHHLKADAPSGTALKTAQAMVSAREKPFRQPPQKEKADSLGQNVEGITIHSVRLPGILASQEVILGCPGQTLTIKHDTTSRECYMPGVILATKEVIKRKGLVHGLDSLLGL